MRNSKLSKLSFLKKKLQGIAKKTNLLHVATDPRRVGRIGIITFSLAREDESVAYTLNPLDTNYNNK